MKNIIFKISALFAAVIGFVGSFYANGGKYPPSKVVLEAISEESPLYLDDASHAIKSQVADTLLAWHSSHYSHSSHTSHYSHYSGR